jgi:hypothetical protein
MRLLTAFLGIVSVLFGLNAGPFLHVHIGDNNDGHGHATLHAHFFDAVPVHSSTAAESRPEIEIEHHHHYGTGVNVMTARERKVQTFIAELHVTKWIIELSVMPGHSVDSTVRTHDPPNQRNFSPRSPPA